jgi:hypothetical protein
MCLILKNVIAWNPFRFHANAPTLKRKTPMTEATTRIHAYHAEAVDIHGKLHLPLTQNVAPQAHTKLIEEGGYLSQHVRDFKLEGVLSFRHAYAQVSGMPGKKPGHGPATLSTSVIEGLNILEILTCDRIVAQISTEHPLDGFVPEISLLGTRFENLRINGHHVNVELDPYIFGEKPANDAPYTKDAGFAKRVTDQHHHIRQHSEAPAEAKGHFSLTPTGFDTLEEVEFSLVNKAHGTYPGVSYGHIIHVPHFGTITLAKVQLKHENPCPQTGSPQCTTISLKMLELKLGCMIDGNMTLGSLVTNGTGGGH